MRAERARGATAPTPGVRLDRELRQAYLRIVEQHAGLRLTEHEARDLELHVGQLMAASAYADPLALYTALAAGARRDLLDDLAAHLTIGETHFFRVQPQIDALREVVLPEIVRRNASQRRIRAWSAGCSTGEEPYTVAILLREQLLAPESWDVQLLGTDINEPALEVARRATYGNWSFRGTTEEVRRRYFKPEGPRWRLVDPVRRMVQFAHLNLLAEPPARSAPGGELAARTSHLDLILCRNVTIYFGPEAVQRVYRRFAEALVDGGWLVLGPSDPTPAQPSALEPVCVPGAVLWRRPTATLAAPPAAPATPPAALPRPTPLRTTRSGQATPPPTPAASLTQAAAVPASADVAQVRALMNGGDRLAARDHAERLTRARPVDAEGYLLLGLLQLDDGAPEQAIESLRRAAFLDPDSVLTQFSLGRAYARLGDWARATRALVHARRLLAATADEQPIRYGDGMLAGDLRHAVSTQLAALDGARR